MRTFISVLLLLSALVSVAGGVPVQAQDDSAPIVILADRKLTVYDPVTGVATPLLPDRVFLEGALSPDNTRLAVSLAAPITVDVWERVGGFSGQPPNELGVVDLRTGALTMLTEQSASAGIFREDGQLDSAMLYQLPVWSPDGTQLAWTQVHYPSYASETNQLMTYDVASGTQRVIASYLPEQAGVPGTIRAFWGPSEIALVYYRYEDGVFFYEIAFFAPDGVLLESTRLPEEINPWEFTWVDYDGQVMFAMDTGSSWQMLDPNTMQLQVLPAVPERLSAANPAGSLALVAEQRANPDPFWATTLWTVRDAAGNVLPFDYPGANVALAPDGQSMAYVDGDGQLVIWHGGQAQATGLPVGGPVVTALFWGATTWRIPVGSQAAIAPFVCEGAPPSRLAVGMNGQVVPNTGPNNMRYEPTTISAVMGQIPAGGEFEIVAGPSCADGFVWWQVSYNGVTGWTAEGQGSDYWLEPLL